MKVEHWCNMTVVAVEAEAGVLEIAQMMRDYEVGQVVVVREAGTLVTPIGIVTDRDLALRTLIAGVDSAGLTAGDVMSRQLLTVLGNDEVDSALAAMRGRKVSRAPVIDEEGALIGILLLRDVLASMANMAVEMFVDNERDASRPDGGDSIPAPDRLNLPPTALTRVARYREHWVTFDFRTRARRQS